MLKPVVNTLWRLNKGSPKIQNRLPPLFINPTKPSKSRSHLLLDASTLQKGKLKIILSDWYFTGERIELLRGYVSGLKSHSCSEARTQIFKSKSTSLLPLPHHP